MTNVVEVVANKAGEVITASTKNADYGWITLRSEAEEFNNGFLRFRQRFAFLSGTVKELELFADRHQLGEGSVMEGRIVVKESLVPINAIDPNVGVKYPNAAAKAVDLACTVTDSDGVISPVYRRTIFTKDGSMQDTFIAHTNGADIQAFMDEQKALAAKANTPALKAGSRKPAGVK
jgi:hypothetical protein